MQELYTQSGVKLASHDVSKLMRNTYLMLAMTLMTSALAAGVAIVLHVSYMMALVADIAALVLLWFVLPRTANSAKGVGVVFAFTALLGFGLGPMLSHYLAMDNGPLMVMQALGGTALVFFALSGYVLTTGKDFSFMGGFLFTGLIVAIVAMLAMFVLSWFGVEVSGFSLALSALMVLLMSGFILFDTSRIINGGETNYLYATTALYLDIVILFQHLLHLIGAFSDD